MLHVCSVNSFYSTFKQYYQQLKANDFYSTDEEILKKVHDKTEEKIKTEISVAKRVEAHVVRDI